MECMIPKTRSALKKNLMLITDFFGAARGVKTD